MFFLHFHEYHHAWDTLGQSLFFLPHVNKEATIDLRIHPARPTPFASIQQNRAHVGSPALPPTLASFQVSSLLIPIPSRSP